MCGRFALAVSGPTIKAHFGVEVSGLSPLYNIAPTEPVLAIRSDEINEWQADWFRWGFVPPWMKEEDISSRFINARADTVHQKPMFRGSFQYRRCLIPASGYFEWDRHSRQPYYFYPEEQQVMAFAGLWSHWENEQTGRVIDSCTILTGDAPKPFAEIHPRMPVILSAEHYDIWLDHRTSTKELREVLEHGDSLKLSTAPVSKKVGNPKNKDASCIESLE